MFAKIIAFAALIAVAFAAPNPEPAPQLVYSSPLAPVGLDVISYSGLPTAYSAPLVSPYAAYPYAPLAYSSGYLLKK